MRVELKSTDLPKASAKRLLKAFRIAKKAGLYSINPIISTMKLSDAQEATARMLGYKDWHEMLEVVTSRAYSDDVPDEKVSGDIENKRLDYQISRLCEIIKHKPTTNIHLNNHSEVVIANIARVSALHAESTKLETNVGTVSKLLYSESDQEWLFQESYRSSLFDYNDSYELWDSGGCTAEELIINAEKIIKEAPESHGAIWLFLCAITEKPRLSKEHRGRIIYHHETAMSWFPIDFDLHENNYVNWDNYENRDFLRLIGLLGQTMYLLKEYNRARFWLERLNSMTDAFTSTYAGIVKDLQKDKPTGKSKVQ